jgi:hypothetical protein
MTSSIMLTRPHRSSLVAMALVTPLLLVARTSHAQTGAPSAAPDAHLQEIIDLPIVDIRSIEEIGKLRSETEERMRNMLGSMAEAERSQESGQARVEVQKMTIEKMKADFKLASKEGIAVPKKTQEAQIKRAEAAQRLLEQYDKTISAKIDAFAAQGEAQQALLDALDREAAVATVTTQMTDLVKAEGVAASTRLGSMQNELTKLEQSSLEGLKKRTEKDKTAAEKLYKLMEERLKFAEMRKDFLAGM